MQPKFNMGDRVRKTKGSEWQGRVVGTYSTTLTPEGYAVESEAHPGSVQIYPASALEAVTEQAYDAATIRAVIARLEQGFGANSAPVFVIKHLFGGE